MKAKRPSTGAKRKSARRPAAARRKSASAPQKNRSRGKSSRRKISRPKLAKKKSIGRRKAAANKPPVAIPPILLEGDRPTTTTRESGPGEKFALPSIAATESSETESTDLPESYGTGRLFAVARDPHCLYAHWDFTRERLSRLNAQSAEGHLVLRVHPGEARKPAVAEYHVHPESRHWFAHVEATATRYVIELGYYQPNRKWTSVAFSEPALTPPDSVSHGAPAVFATIPVDVPFEMMLKWSRESGREHLPLVSAIEELRESSHPGLPHATDAPLEWTTEQERAVAELTRPAPWMSSPEISGLLQDYWGEEVFSWNQAFSGFSPGDDWSVDFDGTENS